MNSDTFKDRLKDAMKGESNRAFADKCGLSEGTLRRYLRGETTPDLEVLQTIAQVSGCNLAWLAAGDVQAGAAPPLDEELLEAVLEAVEEYLDQVKGRLKPDKKAKLVAALYDMVCGEEEKAVDKATVIRLVKLAM